VEIGVFTRAESVAIRQAQVPSLPHAAAEGLAEVLGDLPLAAGYMADSGMPATEYRQLVITRAAAILAEGQVLSYSGTLASATQFAIERLARADPAAAMLAQICAVLAPEPIPLTLFTAACGQLPEALSAAAADPIRWRRLLTALGRSALQENFEGRPTG
jgi:hypothetical protein